jgi:hypothetical protein
MNRDGKGEVEMANLKGKKLKQVIDPTLAKAFAHPLRGHVWVTICEQGTASPSGVAEELGLKAEDLNYHFGELVRRGLIRPIGTQPGKRAFDKHVYEACAPALHFDDAAWMKIPRQIRATLSADAMRNIIEEMIEALNTGSFDARNRHLSQHWLLVDERGWEEVMSDTSQLLDRILAVRKRCAGLNLAESKSGIPLSIVISAFETAAGPARENAEPQAG